MVATRGSTLLHHGGITPLMYAAGKGHTDIARYLCGAIGIQLEIRDNDGFTALYKAICNNEPGVVAVLCDHGVDVNTETYEGSTPLLRAVEGGYTDIVECLCTVSTLRVNVQDRAGSTALHCAVKNDDVKVLKVLCTTPGIRIIKDNAGNTPLSLAVDDNNYPAIFILYRLPGADLNKRYKRGKTLLHIVEESDNVDELRHLCEYPGLSVNAKDDDGCTALHTAVANKHIDALEYLCTLQGIQNIEDNVKNTPLRIAANDESFPLLVPLLLYKLRGVEFNVNERYRGGKTLLHMAVENNNIEDVENLCTQYPHLDVNVQDNERIEPVCRALLNNNQAAVKSILNVSVNKLFTSEDDNDRIAATGSLKSMFDNIVSSAERSEFSKILFNFDLHDSKLLDVLVKNAVDDSSSKELKEPTMVMVNMLISEHPDAGLLIDDPKHSYMFFLGDLYVNLIEKLIGDSFQGNLSCHLKLLFTVLQSKVQCNDSKKKFLPMKLGEVLYEKFKSMIKELAQNIPAISDDEYTIIDVQLIAAKIEKDFIKEKSGCLVNTKRTINDAFKTTADATTSCLSCTEDPENAPVVDANNGCGTSLKNSVQSTMSAIASSMCQEVERPKLEGADISSNTSWFHKCRARGTLAVLFCIIGIGSHVADILSDVVVGAEDLNGFSLRLGIFELFLVVFTLIHENLRSTCSLYEMEEELLRIKLGKSELKIQDWKNSNLNYSENKIALILCSFWPFKWGRTNLSNIPIFLNNLLSLCMLRPLVDRVIVLIHNPTSLRTYYRQQAKQHSLKQFYLILEQLPQLLIQLYTFQIVLNNFATGYKQPECLKITKSAKEFNYTKHSDNDTNMFCDEFFSAGSLCSLYFRIFSMLLPLLGISSGLISLEADFRKLDPLTPKISTFVKIFLYISYVAMVPARWFLMAGLMHIVPYNLIIIGYIVLRALLNLLIVNNVKQCFKAFSKNETESAPGLFSWKTMMKSSSLRAVYWKTMKKLLICVTELWSLFLFSLRDVFIISLRDVEAYTKNPSQVSYESLRSWKQLMLHSLPYFIEGFAGAMLIEHYYPCGKETEIFRYLGWFCFTLLIFSVSLLILMSNLINPLLINTITASFLWKSIVIFICSSAVCSTSFIAFSLSNPRTTTELNVYIGVQCVLLLFLLLIIGYIKRFGDAKRKKADTGSPGSSSWCCPSLLCSSCTIDSNNPAEEGTELQTRSRYETLRNVASSCCCPSLPCIPCKDANNPAEEGTELQTRSRYETLRNVSSLDVRKERESGDIESAITDVSLFIAPDREDADEDHEAAVSAPLLEDLTNI